MTTTIEEESTLSKIAGRASVPAISIGVALILSIFVLLIMGENPILAMKSMSIDIFIDQNGQIQLSTLANIFFYSTPLILTGLSVAVAFRAGMFNIGTEGQVIMGGFLSALVGSALLGAGYNFPFFIMIPLLICCGIIGGALWALVPALLKTRGVHEVITTIMMNYIANTFMVFLIGDLSSPFSDKSLAGNVSPQTPSIGDPGSSARIPAIFGREFSPLHWGFLLNIFVCVVIYIVLWRTQLGYETRAVGHNPSAAKYGGISVNKNLIKVMLISGAIGGLAGSLEVMGPLYGFFLYGSTAGFGFDGIAIAIIGGNHPFGVIFGGILFGWLQAGSTKLQQNQIPKDIANTMKGFIVLLVALPLFSKMLIDKVAKSNTNIGIKLSKIDGRARYIYIWIYLIRELISDFLLDLDRNIVIDLALNFLFIPSIIFYIAISGELVPGLFGGAFILDPPFRIIISGLLAALFFIGYYLMKKNDTRKLWRPFTLQLFLVYCISFGVFTFLSLVKLLGQDAILLVLGLGIILFIVYQEFRARDTETLSKAMKEDELLNTDIDKRSRTLAIYSIASILALVLALLVVVTETIDLPVPIVLPGLGILPLPAFLTLSNLGATIALIGLLIVLVTILMLRKISQPRSRSSIYYLPFLFIFVTVFFGFISVSTIFSMNPFLLFTQTVSIAAPIGFASLGGMFSEKSGVVNIGLEGMMLTGAFVAVWATFVTHDPWMGVIGAVIAGVITGFIMALASIKFRADQVVVGVALNILASALSMLGLVFVWGVRGTSPTVNGLSNVKLPFLADIPVIGDFFYRLSGGVAGLSPLVYMFLFFIILTFWIIERTAFGLRVRAVGEHPRAADTLGINVFKMRYICVILSGVLAGLGGAQLTLGWSPIFGRDMTTGRGFVALAALIFGGWSPIGAGLASLLFGFAYAFRFQLDALGTRWAMSLFGFIWRFEKLTPMLPYLITIIAVSTVAKRTRPPAADGIPYVKEGG